jgi:lipopolysaccharide biosynthesis glycosyltransferase
MNLVYYTVGFDIKYLDLLDVSIQSLRIHNNNTDIIVICDELMVDKCTERLKRFNNLKIVPCTDSISAMDSSMKKLRIFDYNISNYKKILFIDSDILVDIDLRRIFSSIVDQKLYAFAEHKNLGLHATKYHSLMDYTFEDYSFFEEHKIYPFNCGLFGFLNSDKMKEHFSKVLSMIDDYEGDYWYEQSFMNVYFNKLNLVDTNIINESNCAMNIDVTKISPRPWEWRTYRSKIFHFCFTRGTENKLKEMKWWNKKFIPAVNNKTKK